jgi:2-polyprenyl-6-methoxyphenol hydroxylase-like FAD-dependent oxidoreductase
MLAGRYDSRRSHSRRVRLYLIGCDVADSTVGQRLGVPLDGLVYGHTFLLTDARVEGPLRH